MSTTKTLPFTFQNTIKPRVSTPMKEPFARISSDAFSMKVVSSIPHISKIPTLAKVRIIRNSDETISIALVIQNFEVSLRLDEFARILRVLCDGVCMFSPEWSIALLPNCVDPNPTNLTPLDDPVVVQIKTGFRKWGTILSENVIYLSRNKDHPNACLVYMLYCLTNQKCFNLAYYIAKRMASVIKSNFMVLLYAMLLTRLYRHVLTIQPFPTTNVHYLVDHVMVPLTEEACKEDEDDVLGSSMEVKVLGLVVQYGISNLWIRRIEGLGWIRRIHVYSFRVEKWAFHLGNSNRSLLHPGKLQMPVPSAAKDGSLVQMVPSFPLLQQPLPTQPIEASPLAPRALLFTTPPSLPHPYLNSLDDLPPRSSYPPPPPPDQINNQTLPHTTLMDFELSFPPTNFSMRSNRLFVQPEPIMSREQVLEEIGQLQDLSQNIEIALHNAQNVQNGRLPSITPTSTQMPPLPTSLHHNTISTTAILPFRPIFPPSQTFVPLDQSLWIDGTSSFPQSQ
ncbi:hypothetical protein Tco_1377504 [Tanacetum coccineum]